MTPQNILKQTFSHKRERATNKAIESNSGKFFLREKILKGFKGNLKVCQGSLSLQRKKLDVKAFEWIQKSLLIEPGTEFLMQDSSRICSSFCIPAVSRFSKKREFVCFPQTDFFISL
jgi:hypothetical protein